MPNFSRPFPEETKVEGSELLLAIYQSMADEHEAAMRYRLIAEASSNEEVRKVMLSVANEEIVHVGEFKELLKRLFPEELEKVEQGMNEATELLVAKTEETEKKTDKQPAKDTDEEAKEHKVEEAAKTPQGDSHKIKVLRIVSK